MKSNLASCAFAVMFVSVFATLCAIPAALAAAPVCAVDAQPARHPSSVTDSNGMTVIQLDPSMPTEGLKAAGYDVTTADEFNQYDPWTEPSPRLRDRLFAEAGVRPYIGRFDHLKKDMLFLRAQEDSLDQLAKRYPGIPTRVLWTLQQLITGEKGAQK